MSLDYANNFLIQQAIKIFKYWGLLSLKKSTTILLEKELLQRMAICLKFNLVSTFINNMIMNRT